MRVISGGQTGVDQGAWRAASACGIRTGGWMPAGYWTEDGPRPGFRDEFGALPLDFLEGDEHWRNRPFAAQYRERTQRNVDMATHVLILTADQSSPGTVLTRRLASEADVRILEVEVVVPPSGPIRAEVPVVDPVFPFVRECFDVGGTLMVAGTRESKARGIGGWTERFLMPIFRDLSTIVDAGR